jgi:hypothetical protein
MEMVVTSWPLLDGTLLGPRVLSDGIDAPLLGEACILFNLTRRAAPGVEIQQDRAIPPYVYAFLAFYVFSGGLIVLTCVRDCVRLYRRVPVRVPWIPVQGTLAAVAGITAVVAWSGPLPVLALPLAVIALALPWVRGVNGSNTRNVLGTEVQPG